MLIRVKLLPNRSTRSNFNELYSSWISLFDLTTFFIVDLGYKLSIKFARDKIHEVKSKLCPFPTVAPWDIGLNERSHLFLHKSTNRLLLQKD